MRFISKLNLYRFFSGWFKSSRGAMIVLLLVAVIARDCLAAMPEFAQGIANVSVAVGRDATFTCHVRHLGGYRVGWLKADTKAIQAIHENVITHNSRVSVSHLDANTWNLHIKAVSEEDRGGYMCQLNTDPMKSQIGFLDVVIPPDFVSEDTSSDVIVGEGSSVKLTCRARGYPEPIVTWRREDGNEIVLKDNMGTKTLVSSYRGEVLKLTKISRNEMGPYFCIASNGVPPSVSKRISLSIHFHPVIQVPNQLVGAPLGTDVQIECHVEASPKSINYWIKDTGEMIVSSGKYHVQEMIKSAYETKMTMIVRKFQKDDVGSYRCIAKNSLGEVDSSIRLYEIPGPNRKSSLNKHGGQGANGVGGTGGGDADANDILKMKQVKVTYQPDDEDLYGSAEDFGDGDLPPPNSYYPGERGGGGGGNKVPTHKPATSGGEGRHHHHHYHQVNAAAGGGGANNGLGPLFTLNGGGSGGVAESAVNGGAVGDSLNGDGSGGLGVSTSGASRVAASSFMLPLAMWQAGRWGPNELLAPYAAAMWHWWMPAEAEQTNTFEARKLEQQWRWQWQWQILIVLLVTSLITSFRRNLL